MWHHQLAALRITCLHGSKPYLSEICNCWRLTAMKELDVNGIEILKPAKDRESKGRWTHKSQWNPLCGLLCNPKLCPSCLVSCLHFREKNQQSCNLGNCSKVPFTKTFTEEYLYSLVVHLQYTRKFYAGTTCIHVLEGWRICANPLHLYPAYILQHIQ